MSKSPTHYRNKRADATPEERRRYKAAVEQVERDKAGILAEARRAKARAEMLRSVLHDLKAERERQGLSLADVSARSGIDKGALSRLENAANANPKLDTLTRYADALGVKLRISVADKAA